MIRNIYILLLFAFGWGQVSLEIQNVDTDVGTLDIYMTNAAACSYCADSTYNDNSEDWSNRKEGCENRIHHSAYWFGDI